METPLRFCSPFKNQIWSLCLKENIATKIGKDLQLLPNKVDIPTVDQVHLA